MKAKIEAEKAEKKAAGGVEEEYTGPKLVERKMNKSHIISFSPLPRKLVHGNTVPLYGG